MSDDYQKKQRNPTETMRATTEKRGFLTRWSQRKVRDSVHQQQQTKTLGHQEPVMLPVVEDVSAAAVVDKTDIDMPSIEALGENSDVSAFFSPKVSEQLRQLALRKLFHMPGFNITDGLDDYAEDYRNFTALGNIITADMRHQLERLNSEMDQRLIEASPEKLPPEKLPKETESSLRVANEDSEQLPTEQPLQDDNS